MAMLKNTREGRVKGRGFDDFQEDGFERPSPTVDTIIWISELRMKSQYTREIASSVVTHN